MKIVTADGRTVETAYMNAWNADPALEGVRIGISIASGQPRAHVHPEDRDAVAHVEAEDLGRILDRAAAIAANGEADMCDDREVEAWII